jgi:hypothetical protein
MIGFNVELNESSDIISRLSNNWNYDAAAARGV